jgi:hypothetical protein
MLTPVLPSLVLCCLYVLLFAYLAHRTIVRQAQGGISTHSH